MSSIKKSELLKRYSSKVLEEATAHLYSLVPTCGMPVYSSIDLRDSGTRLVAVDVNLFPGGFNNLNSNSIGRATQEMKAALKEKLKKDSDWKIGLVPESHTNNEGYLQ